MPGQRLADLLALAAATRNVIRRHVDVKLQSAARAAATSSITKALKPDFCRPPRDKPSAPSATPSSTSAVKEDKLLDGKDQDVFYERSESHSAPASRGPDELKVGQSEFSTDSQTQWEEHKPTSASPSTSSKPTSPIQDHHVRTMWTQRSLPSETAGDTNELSDLRKNIDEEVYYEPQASTAPNKEFEPDHIPQEAAEPPTPHDKLHDGINSDVYYDPEPNPDTKTSQLKSVFLSL
jgi:hypothetical protein